MTEENLVLNQIIKSLESLDYTKTTLTLKRNWLLKNSLKSRRKTFNRLKRQIVGTCDVCHGRFVDLWHDMQRQGEYFQALNCAGHVSLDNKLNHYIISTEYGSEFDGYVFLVKNVKKYKNLKNVCDICISKGMIEDELDYLYNYMSRGLEYNQQYEVMIKEVFGEGVTPVEDHFLSSLRYYCMQCSGLRED